MSGAGAASRVAGQIPLCVDGDGVTIESVRWVDSRAAIEIEAFGVNYPGDPRPVGSDSGDLRALGVHVDHPQVATRCGSDPPTMLVLQLSLPTPDTPAATAVGLEVTSSDGTVTVPFEVILCSGGCDAQDS